MVVEIDEFAVFPMLGLHIFISFGNKVDIVVAYTRTTVLDIIMLSPIRMTLNDFECPIHLKVRFPDDTFDVRMLRLLELLMRG